MLVFKLMLLEDTGVTAGSYCFHDLYALASGSSEKRKRNVAAVTL